MVGVDLTASWQTKRKMNMDEIQTRVQRCISSWKSGKFLPLVSRPFSLNTYCSSKVWFRTSSADMRAGDSLAINSRLKSYCYQDLFQKQVKFYSTVELKRVALDYTISKAKHWQTLSQHSCRQPVTKLLELFIPFQAV